MVHLSSYILPKYLTYGAFVHGREGGILITELIKSVFKIKRENISTERSSLRSKAEFPGN